MTMTREEAKDILKAIQALICPNKESVLENNFSEAFDVAIEALSENKTARIINEKGKTISSGMTKEEARNHLAEWLDEKMWRCFGTIDKEAISIAVEALSADAD